MFSEYKFKTELHAHTSPVSKCSQIPAEDMAKIYADLGYSSIAITNHMCPGLYPTLTRDKFIEYYINDYNIVRHEGERFGLNVILGVELRFTENINDYLIYGIDESDLYTMYDMMDVGIAEFYRQFKNDRNVILQAHPFRNDMSRAPVDAIDGIEVFNLHPGHNSRVAIASKYARENDYIATCGTDFHHPGHEGLSALLSKEAPRDSFELAALLKSRDYLFKLGETTALPYV